MRNSGFTFSESDSLRFWSKVNRASESECWEWTGSLTKQGYGQFSLNKYPHLSHRVSYQIHVCEIGAGLFVCHKCDNRKCVNPSHLFVGTHQDNMKDCHQKGRVRSGNRHPFKLRPECVPKGMLRGNVKLTNDSVKEIRTRTKPVRFYVESIGVCESTIYKVIRGEIWNHV